LFVRYKKTKKQKNAPKPTGKKIKKGKKEKKMRRVALGIAAGCFVGFVACFGWSILALVRAGDVVVAVACMCATLVTSFGLLMCHFVVSAPTISNAPTAPRRIEVRVVRSHEPIVTRVRHATVSDGSTVAIASRASPVSPKSPTSPGSPGSPTLWVFEPS
jgi:hypothetical protein